MKYVYEHILNQQRQIIIEFKKASHICYFTPQMQFVFIGL